MHSKIFLDGGDPAETREILALLPSLHGQTTNPTLIAKNPYAKARFEKGEKFTKKEILDFYRSVVTDISALIPKGSVSIEVYSDKNTTGDAMFAEGKEMYAWIPNVYPAGSPTESQNSDDGGKLRTSGGAHIKYPTTKAGLEAAERSIKDGMRVNITLVFSAEQAAAVHAATRGAKKGDVFVSPFIGRLDDIGENGMDLIKNIRRMYDEVGSHVEILAASIRSMDHFLASLALKADILTAPAKNIREWVASGKPTPKAYDYDAKNLKPIPYRKLDLSKNWRDYDISNPLTDKGVERFASDWNGLIR